jgi:prefoldin subunit 5
VSYVNAAQYELQRVLDQWDDEREALGRVAADLEEEIAERDNRIEALEQEVDRLMIRNAELLSALAFTQRPNT